MAMNRAAWTHFSNSFELVWPIFRWGRLQRLDCWSVHLDALGVHGRPGGRGCVSLGHLGCGWVLWSWVMNWKALRTSWFWNIEFRGLQWYVNLCCGGKRFCSFCYFLSLDWTVRHHEETLGVCWQTQNAARRYAQEFLETMRKQTTWTEAALQLVRKTLEATILLMAEILHQLIGSLSRYLQGFIHPRWRRICSINSMLWNPSSNFFYRIQIVKLAAQLGLRHIFWHEFNWDELRWIKYRTCVPERSWIKYRTCVPEGSSTKVGLHATSRFAKSQKYILYHIGWHGFP